MDFVKILSQEFNTAEKYVENIINLIEEGNTLPFIARYRKEMTGTIDDQVLRDLADRLTYLQNLLKRKNEVLASIESQGKLTEEIREAVDKAITLAEVEDIYRPYKKKKTTRASLARERGLEPLAQIIWSGDCGNIPELAKEYIDEEKKLPDTDSVISGALDIIAEDVSDDAILRKILRLYLAKNAILTSEAKVSEDTVYNMYYEYSESVFKIPSHRILAINRGESENILKVSIEVNNEECLERIYRHISLNEKYHKSYVKAACDDSFDRLIFPSLERELRNDLTDRASEAAIKNFSINLKNLLMSPPVKGHTTLGLDPAYRTGCKIAIVDETGKVLHTAVMYPTPPQSRTEESAKMLKQFIEKYKVSVIAIGNGTASRESEQFVADTIKDIPGVSYMIVSEAGASVYSASKLAAEEFPDFDVSLRSGVSIARRLQDPLAELVKIDPKAIGVGQYQHDMPKDRLSSALSGVVEDCVNSVGVDLNTASESLLSYISGVNSATAKNIVAYRKEIGKYKARSELLKVPKLGKKAFEQCAGFLRIPEGKEIFDNTSVHPESYKSAKELLKICNYSTEDVKKQRVSDLSEKAEAYGISKLADELKIGTPTLRDIIAELKKPGRDPRDELPPPILRKDVMSISDIKEGMKLKGTVRNVIDFGAFIDIGVHDDGLVHISQICDKYIRHPSEVLKVGDTVDVKVLSVDIAKKRIALTMK